MSDEALQALSRTIEKYRKNRTMVPKTDLLGKYIVPYTKLRDQLREDIKVYLASTVWPDIYVFENDFDNFVKSFEKIIKDLDAEHRLSEAAYERYDITEIQSIACELREAILRLYKAYVDKYTCLYAKDECWDVEKPCDPLIYNDIRNQFWDKRMGWRDPLPGEAGPAIKIYVRRQT